MREGCWLPFHKHIYRKRLSMFFYSQALNFETIEHRKIYFCCDNTQISSEARWGDEKKWRQCYGVSSAPEPRETIWAALLDSSQCDQLLRGTSNFHQATFSTITELGIFKKKHTGVVFLGSGKFICSLSSLISLVLTAQSCPFQLFHWFFCEISYCLWQIHQVCLFHLSQHHLTTFTFMRLTD